MSLEMGQQMWKQSDSVNGVDKLINSANYAALVIVADLTGPCEIQLYPK